MESDAAVEKALVFVVDDDLSVRESLFSLLRSVGHDVQLFDSVPAFLDRRGSAAADCLVLDVRLPGQSGLELQRELTGAGSDLPIVFITGHGDVPMSVTAMKAGAIEFLTKPFRDQDLLDAVQRGIDLSRRRRADTAHMDDLNRRYESLSPREREIMVLVCSGMMNKQIAAELQLSEITVKVHRGKVMRKMQVESLPELVRLSDRLTANEGKV
ncbi:response regulator [Pelagibius sp. 7325]|uniref:response regulator transcription factor n=1 Tax=Pelagibius sp. 7325 TaxID=3131994 RepID=UPI0030EB3941